MRVANWIADELEDARASRDSRSHDELAGHAPPGGRTAPHVCQKLRRLREARFDSEQLSEEQLARPAKCRARRRVDLADPSHRIDRAQADGGALVQPCVARRRLLEEDVYLA